MASSQQAREVIVCDLDDHRLRQAKQFGATHTVRVEPDSQALQAIVMETTRGRGADLVLEMSGSPDAVETGMDLLRTGGQYIWVGAVSPTRPVSLSAETVVRKMLKIQGVHNYTPADLADALVFLESRRRHFPFETLVSMSFCLEEANVAFEEAANSGSLRVAVCPK